MCEINRLGFVGKEKFILKELHGRLDYLYALNTCYKLNIDKILKRAVKEGCVHVVKMFAKHDTNLLKKTRDNEMYMYMVKTIEKTSPDKFIIACQHGILPKVKKYINGSDIRNGIYCAVYTGHIDIIDFFLENEFTTLNKCLKYAIETNEVDIATEMINRGAIYTIDLPRILSPDMLILLTSSFMVRELNISCYHLDHLACIIENHNNDLRENRIFRNKITLTINY